MNKVRIIGIVIAAASAFGCATMAQQAPYVDIGPRHGNRRGAQ